MTDHGESSQTASFNGEYCEHSGTELSYVEQCMSIVDRYKRGSISKGDAVLKVRDALDSFAIEHSVEWALESTFSTYLDMLDDVDRTYRTPRGTTGRGSARQSSPHLNPEEPCRLRSIHRPRSRSVVPQRERQAVRERSDDEWEEEEEPVRKRGRGVVDPSRFPWNASSAAHRTALSSELQEILDLLENWSYDPVFVVRQIMLAADSPDFPYDQWLNIVKGLPVELEKVLGAHHSLSLESKQSRDVGDLFQLVVKTPKVSRAIQTPHEWTVAFGKATKATAYVLPQRRSEYDAWNEYISGLFTSYLPYYHQCIINFDKAVRLRAANRKVLRLTDYAAFEDLRAAHLSPMGVGPYPGNPGSSGSAGQRTDRNIEGKRAPCHKWNRGTCEKSTAECFYEHCCDRRNCRGPHRRPEHPTAPKAAPSK